MRYARIAPILLSGLALGIASFSAPRTPHAPRSGAAAGTATLDPVGGGLPIRVTALALGDELRISYESHGCFHHYRYALTIRRAGSGADVRLDSAAANLAPGRKMVLRRTHVDVLDLLRLEKLLEFYRSNTRQGCTTVDAIEVTSVEGEVVRKESYVDASCGTSEDETVLPIWQLVTMSNDSTAVPPPR